MSRLKRLITPDLLAEGKNLVDPRPETEDDDEHAFYVDLSYSGLQDEEIFNVLECYLNLPEMDNPELNPLNFFHIREQQQECTALLSQEQQYPNNYVRKKLDDLVDSIICYVRDQEDTDTQW